MLVMDPDKRPSFDVLRGHTWLTTNVKPSRKLHTGLAKSLMGFRTSKKIKKLVLSVMAQQMNDKDIQELKDSFRALDVNNDGTLTIDEITKGIEMMGNSDKIPLQCLEELDTDGSGSIDYTEFIAATLESKRHINSTKIREACRF